MKSYVLITGAAGGLGKAFAAECAARGWDLVLTDLSQASLAVLAEGLTRLHNVDIRCLPCNLTDESKRAAFWETARRLNLQFHLLINVAGIDYEGPFAERSEEELNTIVRLNVESVVAMTSQVLQHRDGTRTLRIINVSSLAGFYPMPVKAVYAASKRFLLDFSRALHSELREQDVTVTALCPAGMPSNAALVKAIDVQGLMGRITTRNVGFVAAKTIDHALAGHSVYIPGVINRVLRFLGGLVPASLVAALIGRRWRKARGRRTEQRHCQPECGA